MDINRDNEYKKTLKKLKKIFKDVDEDKKELVNNLITDYVFLFVDNLILKELIKAHGSVLVNPDDPLKQKQSEASKQYHKNSNTMNMHTRTLLLMLRNQDGDGDDAIDKFMKTHGNKK